MYAIIIYREHDADTSVNGPYSTVEDAIRAMRDMAVDLAEGVEGRIVQELNPDDPGDDSLIVFDSDYRETEPTDDDHHITLDVQLMGQPRGTRCPVCGDATGVRCCEHGRDR